MRPIDADALISDIESARNMLFHSPYERRFHEDRIEFALNMVEDVPTIDYVPRQQWISVKDRLPPRYKKILVANGHGYVNISAFAKELDGEWTWLGLDGKYNHINDITHWMPLPEAPKGGKKNDTGTA